MSVPCLLVVLRRVLFVSKLGFFVCVFYMFSSENKVDFCRIKSLKNNFIKKGPKCRKKNIKHCRYPLPNSVSPVCPGRLRGLSGCLGREEAEVGPVNAACCWGLAEGEGLRITEEEEPK